MRTTLVTLALIVTACGEPAPSPPEPVNVPRRDPEAEAARASYAAHRDALEADRRALAERLIASPASRTTVIAEARARLERAFREDLMPAWRGTTWAFSGTSKVPGVGTIACGHFVSTVIDQLGFDVERIRLGQQASEHIARTFVPKADVMRFSRRSADDVVAAVRDHGDGIYALGLDRHAGFLDVHDGRVDMCHASNLYPGSVVCEPARDAAAFRSNYRIAGRLFDDAMVEGWLGGKHFETYRPDP